MSTLKTYSDDGVHAEQAVTDHQDITERLGTLGVRFERWKAHLPLASDASPEIVINAYKDSIDRLTDEFGFKSVDVVNIGPDHPERDSLRRKFLDEHVHSDFEVRFFVDGSGLFYLHVGDKVHCVFCERGDLISVPAGTPHWFDMGEHPDFKCIRLFTTPDGWVAEFTGSDIAKRFPTFDDFAADL